MRVCLVTRHCKPAFVPLALYYLKVCLVRLHGCAGDDVVIIEPGPEASEDDLVDAIVRTKPDIVGLSCYVWNVRLLMAVARRIRDVLPDARIVCGGPEVGPVAPSVLAANPAIDVIVNGEGEVPFGELFDAWRDGQDDVSHVHGICRRAGGKVVQHEEAPILRDLNLIPSPYLAGLAPDRPARRICIETQRGCVFRCNFCFYNKDLSVRNRRFDLDRVKAEILYWLERDVVSIYLMDPVFNLNAQRTKEILRFIAEHNRRRAPFQAEVWAEFIDAEMAMLFRDAGFRFLEVGLQSTDDEALATADRRLRRDRFVEGVGHLRSYGVPFELQLIYGLPGETRDSFRASLDFAAALEPGRLEVFPLMVLPGTELWRKADVLGLEYDPDPPYFVRSHLTMTADDIRHGHDVTEAVAELAHRRSVTLLGRELGLSLSAIVDIWIDWFSSASWADQTADPVVPFIQLLCDRHGVPADFYRAFASRETAARLPLSVDRRSA